MKKALIKLIIPICLIFAIFPQTLSYLVFGSLYLIGNLFTYEKNYTYSLDENTIATLQCHYDGLPFGINSSKINLITNNGTFSIGEHESLTSKEINLKDLFQKIKSTDEYDIYYLNTTRVYDAKDNKTGPLIRPFILFKNGNIKFYENNTLEKNEFEKSLVEESNTVFRNARIDIMKNEINNFYNKNIFLSSWKVLNSLECEKTWINNKIDAYFTKNDIPENLKNLDMDNNRDKLIWTEYIECLNKILCLRGNRIFYKNEYTKENYFDNFNDFKEISIDEAIKRYGSDNIKINGDIYEFNDMTLEFNTDLYHNKKILIKAEIKRPIFYLQGEEIINKKYTEVKKVLSECALYRYKINDDINFPKEILLPDNWSVIIDEDGIVSKVLYNNDI